MNFKVICKLSFVLILCQYIKTGYSLKCFSCSASGGHNAPCENITNHVDDISRQECFYDGAVCATYKIEYGNSVMVYRSCKEQNVCSSLAIKYNSQFNKLLDCQTCHERDLCNASSNLFTSYSLKGILFIMLCLYFNNFQ